MNASCSDAIHGELREEKETKARRRRERGRWRARERSVVDLESLDGRETGIGLHDGNDTAMGASGGVGAITATCSTRRNREKRGRENDTWGPHVRFDFHLISNFWIVTDTNTFFLPR